MIVNFTVIEHIVMNEPLLARVEEKLLTAGQEQLAAMLNKLQQDAGLKYFDSIGDGTGVDDTTPAGICRVKQFIDEDNLPITNPMVDGYEDIPPARLQVFDLIRDALQGQDSEYIAFMDGLRQRSHPATPVYGSVLPEPGP